MECGWNAAQKLDDHMELRIVVNASLILSWIGLSKWGITHRHCYYYNGREKVTADENRMLKEATTRVTPRK